MAVGLLFDGSGVTRDQYSQVLNDVTANGITTQPTVFEIVNSVVDGD